MPNMTCPHGTFGLDTCKGPVELVNGKPMCRYHRLKREVFGGPLTRPTPTAPSRMAPCPACGHAWYVK